VVLRYKRKFRTLRKHYDRNTFVFFACDQYYKIYNGMRVKLFAYNRAVNLIFV